jgi:hypothetical protein
MNAAWRAFHNRNSLKDMEASMGKKYSSMAIILIGLFIGIFFWQNRSIPAAGNAEQANQSLINAAVVNIQPHTQTVGLGETFNITVAITSLTTPLSAFQFDLGYDPGIVRFVGFAPGGFLASTGRSSVCPLPAFPGAGTVRLACAAAGKETGPLGNGNLLILTFTPLQTGTTPITLSSLQLAGPGLPPANITATTQGGTVIVVTEVPHAYQIRLPIVGKNH